METISARPTVSVPGPAPGVCAEEQVRHGKADNGVAQEGEGLVMLGRRMLVGERRVRQRLDQEVGDYG